MTEPKKKRSPRGHKQKGDKYERELAEFFNEQLFANNPIPQVHRTPLSGSFSVHKGVGSADLTGTPLLWVEAKRVERLNFHDAIAQAERGTNACGRIDMPVVINRRNQQATEDSTVVLRLSDFMKLYKAFIQSLGYGTS